MNNRTQGTEFKTEITVSVDLTAIPKEIGFKRYDGKMIYAPSHLKQIKEWLDDKFNVVPAIDKKIIVSVTGPMTPWFALYLGQYLDSKADIIVLITPQLPGGWVVKGAL